ncbi:MAG: hypothetical protein ACTSVV_11040 [Promethearchaeota archaeon]
MIENKNNYYSLEENVQRFEKKLEKIITKEEILRDPSITIIHISKKDYMHGSKSIVQLLKKLNSKYDNWKFFTFNAEKEVFDILKEFRYIDKQKFVLTCEREELQEDLRNSVKTMLINRIEKKIEEIKEESQSHLDADPYVLLVFNMHSNYDYIQIKDLIARINNKKGVYILILYLDTTLKENSKLRVNQNSDDLPYKHANYNVNTFFL